MLKRWSKKCEEHAMQLGSNTRAYVEAHPLRDNVMLEYRHEQIRNVMECTKIAITYEGDNIRKYLYGQEKFKKKIMVE